MIRVLIADDSRTAGDDLEQILASDPEIAVAGRVGNGAAAVEATRRLRPDVIVLEVNMPRMDGIEATRRIMAETPTPIVVASSSTTADHADVSFAALQAGALVLVAKPAAIASPQFEQSVLGFVANVKAMAGVKVVRRWGTKADGRTASPDLAAAPEHEPRVIVLGASTGGPAALGRILPELPEDFSAPILVVQHMAPEFVVGLTRWLAPKCRMKVKIASMGEALAPATVYVAGDRRHMGISRKARIHLDGGQAIDGFRPSVTHLFATAAEVYGASTAAVILTGMGDDGVAGLRAVRNAGGHVIAQDETTSVVFGMPRAAISAGLANVVLPLPAIAEHLTKLARHRYPSRTKEPAQCAAS